MSTIVLESYLRIGDRVQAVYTADTWVGAGWPADKTSGTVIGFKRFEQFYNRVNRYSQLAPGVYECNGASVVLWDTGASGTISPLNLVFCHDHGATKQARQDDEQYIEAFKQHLFLKELPETTCWEDDVVTVLNPTLQRMWDTDTLRISSINYHLIGQLRDDGSPMPIYDVNPLIDNQGSTWAGEEDVQLLRRGNVWNWYNNRSEVFFADLESEIRFHMKLGLYNEVRNPATKDYAWVSTTAIRVALQDETVDCTSRLLDNKNARTGYYDRAYKLHDAELGARVRKLMLADYY